MRFLKLLLSAPFMAAAFALSFVAIVCAVLTSHCAEVVRNIHDVE